MSGPDVGAPRGFGSGGRRVVGAGEGVGDGVVGGVGAGEGVGLGVDAGAVVVAGEVVGAVAGGGVVVGAGGGVGPAIMARRGRESITAGWRRIGGDISGDGGDRGLGLCCGRVRSRRV